MVYVCALFISCQVIPIERLYDIPQLFHSLDSEASLREIIRRHSQFEVW